MENARSVYAPQPTFQDVIAHHREVTLRIARREARSVGGRLILEDAVFGARKDGNVDGPAAGRKHVKTPDRFSAWRVEIVASEYPQLRGAQAAQYRHRIVVERHARKHLRSSLAHFRLRQL